MNMYQGSVARRCRDAAASWRSSASSSPLPAGRTAGRLPRPRRCRSDRAAPRRCRRQAPCPCCRACSSRIRLHDQPQHEQHGDGDPARDLGFQRMQLAEPEQWPEEPDEHREHGDAKEGAATSGCGRSEESVEHPRLTSRRRAHEHDLGAAILLASLGGRVRARSDCPGPCPARAAVLILQVRAQTAATASARACDNSKLDGKPCGMDRLVVGEAIDRDGASLVIECVADARQQRGRASPGSPRRSRTCCGWSAAL